MKKVEKRITTLFTNINSLDISDMKNLSKKL